MEPTPKLDRFQLYTSLAATIGEQEAATVVSSITRNHDLVTKDHFDARLAEMNARMDTGFAQVDARFAQADAKLERALRNQMIWTITTIIAANTALAGILTTIH